MELRAEIHRQRLQSTDHEEPLLTPTTINAVRFMGRYPIVYVDLICVAVADVAGGVFVVVYLLLAWLAFSAYHIIYLDVIEIPSINAFTAQPTFSVACVDSTI